MNTPTMTNLHRKAFTLIELLTVIAIIGILAGILIPVVSKAQEAALKAKSKAQFTQYATALQQYKQEYGYWPPIGGLHTGETLDLSSGSNSENFIGALTGINPLTGAPSTENNRRGVAFMSISEGELFYDETTGTTEPGKLADGFNNKGIKIRVDDDGNGKIDQLPGNASTITGSVAIWTEADSEKQWKNVRSWE